MTSQTPPQGLEAFQRWALTIDDELREAVDAVEALGNPDAAPLCDRDVILDSERSSFERYKASGSRPRPFARVRIARRRSICCGASPRAQSTWDTLTR